MNLTNNDKMFLQEVRKISKQNTESEKQISIVTNVALLSEDLLSIFDIEKNHRGGWFFNVYVEFEPMFKNQEAKDWQK